MRPADALCAVVLEMGRKGRVFCAAVCPRAVVFDLSRARVSSQPLSNAVCPQLKVKSQKLISVQKVTKK